MVPCDEQGEKIRKNIFRDRHDYQVFIKLLEESSEMWNIRVADYCLITNHYHILIQTPNANIARSMGVQRDAHDFMRFLFCFRSFAKIADIKALTQISTNFLLSVTGK
ncbi:MAG: transposase, partial [Thermodesulfobacteriota bacterium]|nr:transposase [Thermodesulfobacteriota bacterium]